VAIAADGDEVQVSGLLVSNETFGHGASLEESGSLTRITHPLRWNRKGMGHPVWWRMIDDGSFGFVAGDYTVILSPWLGGWLVTRKRAGAVLRLLA